MISPVFSIITPTYNRPLLLKRNILSVRNQTFENYEHIIVDDGCSPENKEVAESFNDSRIRFLSHQTREGAAASYNSGLRISGGKYILFLDDDDEYLPDFLKRMHETFSLKGPSTGFIWSGISRVRDTESGEKHLFSLVWPPVFTDKEEGLVAATSIGNGFGVCVRKECFSKVGIYDESLSVSEDSDLLFRLAMNYGFETIPEVLVKIHQHASSQLTSDNNYSDRIRGKEIIFERYSEFLEEHPRVKKVHYKAYADLCYQFRLKKKGRKAMMYVTKNFPFDYLTLADFLSYEFTGKELFKTSFGKKLISFVRAIKKITANA